MSKRKLLYLTAKDGVSGANHKGVAVTDRVADRDIPGVGQFVCGTHQEAVADEMVGSAVADSQHDGTVVGE